MSLALFLSFYCCSSLFSVNIATHRCRNTEALKSEMARKSVVFGAWVAKNEECVVRAILALREGSKE